MFNPEYLRGKRKMELKFNDGITIDTGGSLRKLHLADGWYVVGEGYCIPVADEGEADDTIVEMAVRREKQLTATLFVYGTLRKGQGNHHLLRSSTFLGLAKTKDCYALYGGSIPFLSRTESISQVTGEVYSVDGAILERLDELEGHPHAYKREQAEVVLENGTEVTAWIYFHDKPVGHLIESGDFLESRKAPSRRRQRRV